MIVRDGHDACASAPAGNVSAAAAPAAWTMNVRRLTLRRAMSEVDGRMAVPLECLEHGNDVASKKARTVPQ